jgi:hypothetical protein
VPVGVGAPNVIVSEIAGRGAGHDGGGPRRGCWLPPEKISPS